MLRRRVDQCDHVAVLVSVGGRSGSERPQGRFHFSFISSGSLVVPCRRDVIDMDGSFFTALECSGCDPSLSVSQKQEE